MKITDFNIYQKDDFKFIESGNTKICVAGVAKLFYQSGFPISMAVTLFKEQGVQVSLLHLIDEFWNNGWSWKTIEMKLRGELSDDIEKVLDVNFQELESFYNLLEQPKRANGGYEESREVIYKYISTVFDKPL
jgi:hypothetical protein